MNEPKRNPGRIDPETPLKAEIRMLKSLLRRALESVPACRATLRQEMREALR